MTTTYLYVHNMVDDGSIEDVKKMLTNMGYKSVIVMKGEARFGSDNVSHDDLKVIKNRLHARGYELDSVCQTSWMKRPEGINIL